MRRMYSGSNTAFIGLMAESGSFNCVEQRALEHLGVDRGFVGGVFVDVPAAEDQVVQAGQRNEILDLGRAAVGALSQANGRQAASAIRSGVRSAALDGFHAGDEGGAHRADSGNQDAKLSVGGRNLDVIFERANC